MLLASSWFGHRARDLGLQLRQSALLRFAGVALLPGNEPPPEPWPDSERFPAGTRVGAASWDALLEPDATLRAVGRAWDPRHARQLVSALLRLRCDTLILPVGTDRQAGAHERGERLLGRLRGGDSLREDEALEELGKGSDLLAERQLEELAVLLHQLRRAVPELRIALAPGASPAALLTPDRLQLLLAELPDPAIGLWHDPADAESRAALRLPPAGAWLDGFRGRILGVTLCDSAGGRDRVPPGAGTVDWTLLAEYLPREAVRVLDLAPSYSEDWLAEARVVLEARRIHS